MWIKRGLSRKRGGDALKEPSKNHLLQPREGGRPLPRPSPETVGKTNTRVMVGFTSLGSLLPEVRVQKRPMADT